MALVQPYDPEWPGRFARAADPLAAQIPLLHHIGSTAVPGLAAKPTIDILGVMPDREALRSVLPAIVALGYDARGERGCPGREFLRLMEGGTRAVHLHIVARGSQHIAGYLAFRDWLRAHPDRALEYGDLKLALAARPGLGRAEYVADKEAFVRRASAEALAWAARQDSHRLRRR